MSKVRKHRDIFKKDVGLLGEVAMSCPHKFAIGIPVKVYSVQVRVFFERVPERHPALSLRGRPESHVPVCTLYTWLRCSDVLGGLIKTHLLIGNGLRSSCLIQARKENLHRASHIHKLRKVHEEIANVGTALTFNGTPNFLGDCELRTYFWSMVLRPDYVQQPFTCDLFIVSIEADLSFLKWVTCTYVAYSLVEQLSYLIAEIGRSVRVFCLRVFGIPAPNNARR